MKRIYIAAAASLAISGVAVPVAAQSLGEEVYSCSVTSARNLGQFADIAAAVGAARENGVGGSGYAVATVDGRRIAIDASFVAHPVNEVPCSGSGPGLKKPD